MELDRYNVDIVVLCEIRFVDFGSIVEEWVGYIIFWSGSLVVEWCLYGVVVVICMLLVKGIIFKFISERFIIIRLLIGG